MRTTRRGLGLLLVAGLGLVAASCGSGDDENRAQGSAGADGPVTITVGCQPPKSNPKEREAWDEDVAAFQKLHPNITIQSKDAFPCINPDTFQAKLAGGSHGGRLLRLLHRRPEDHQSQAGRRHQPVRQRA